MMRVHLSLVAAALVTLPISAVAQDAPSQSPAPATGGKDIVVTARERTVIDQFVQNLTDPARSDQVPRWDLPLCTGIVGLAPKHAVVLNGRIEETARAIGYPVGKEGCRPNAVVLVTRNPEEIAARLRSRYPRTLGQEGRARLRHFADTTQPVRWISQVAELPFDGSPVKDANGLANGAGRAIGVGRLSGSRLQKSTRTVLDNMLVIVDAERLAGLSLGQIGDYLAMVVLARPPLETNAPEGSILSVFDQGSSVAGLSDNDRAFLRALYAAPDSVSAQVQRSAMRKAMKR